MSAFLVRIFLILWIVCFINSMGMQSFGTGETTGCVKALVTHREPQGKKNFSWR